MSAEPGQSSPYRSPHGQTNSLSAGNSSTPAATPASTPSTTRPKQRGNVWMPTLTPTALATRYPQRGLDPKQLQPAAPPQNQKRPSTPSGTPSQRPLHTPSTAQQSPRPASPQPLDQTPVPPPIPHATRPKIHNAQAQPVPGSPYPAQSTPQAQAPQPAPAPVPHYAPELQNATAQQPIHSQLPPPQAQTRSPAPPRPSGTGAVFEVGMIYPSMEEAREALLCHTIAKHESYRVYKSDARRYMTRCRNRDCNYMVRVSWRKKRCEAFVSMYKPHTCSPDTHGNWRPAASVNYLAPTYQSLVQGSSKPTAAQILEIERRRGNPIQYHQGYRTLKAIERNLYGDAAESFEKLPAFLSRLAKVDHAGYWKMETKNDVFHRCFVAPAATLHAYTHCRRFLTIDRAPWKTKWDFSLLVAATLDANDQVLPLAWAVVPDEKVESWAFFLRHMRLAFPKIDSPRTALLLNPRLAIDDAVTQELPAIAMMYCCEYLSQTLMEKFRPEEEVRKQFWKAARAESEPIFAQAIAQIKHPGAKQWIESIPRQRWAKHALPVPRYEQLSMTTMESLHFLWLNTRNLPVLRALYSIWLNITDRLHHCREIEFKRSNTLTDFAQEWIMRQTQLSRTYTAVASSQEQFTVFNKAVGFVVDLNARTCSCLDWQDLQLPCRHALAAIATTSRPINDFVPPAYHTSTYKQIYTGVTMPLELRDLDNFGQCSAPATKRRGRPSSNPSKQKDAGAQTHCSVCRQPGHSGQSDICPTKLKERNIVVQNLPDGIRAFEHKPGPPPSKSQYPAVAVVVPAKPTITQPTTSTPDAPTVCVPRRPRGSSSSSSDDDNEDKTPSNVGNDAGSDRPSLDPGFTQIPPLPAEQDSRGVNKPATRRPSLKFAPAPSEVGSRLEWALDAKKRLDAEKKYLSYEELSRLQGHILDGLFLANV
ncbi:hypothetical protein CNMCM6805_006873 [Aspergillus fumigatiaffinis]|uniref:SWIM-type domain-containing protein n=1 Tax=Aspergillus fumigatiaffinis TaxID=340414 RepID=A0A8H4H8I4_9EURO|nr:hypothetical protein CNMCM6805_006873 [Aspergillus fumigatiaffinis]